METMKKTNRRSRRDDTTGAKNETQDSSNEYDGVEYISEKMIRWGKAPPTSSKRYIIQIHSM